MEKYVFHCNDLVSKDRTRMKMNKYVEEEEQEEMWGREERESKGTER